MKPLIKIIFLLFTLSCSPQKEKSTISLTKEQKLLTHGYSHLYKFLSAFTSTKLILYSKLESDKIDEYGSMVTEAGKNMKSILEKLSKDTDWLKFGDTGQSEIQIRLFNAMTKSTIKKYLPLVGSKKPIFERTLLLNTVGVLEQVIFLIDIILDIESSDIRKDELKKMRKDCIKIKERGSKILNSFYFKHNQYN